MKRGDDMFHVRVRYENGEADYICMHCEEIGNVLKLQHIKYRPYKDIIYIPLGSSAIIDVQVMPWSLADDYDDTELNRRFISEFEKTEQDWWKDAVLAPVQFNQPTHEKYTERCNHVQSEGAYDE